jgi:hypothetical protein
MMGGAPASMARPSTRPGSRLSRPTTDSPRSTSAGGPAMSQAMAIRSGRGRATRARKAPESTRAKVMVTKQKIDTPRSGRAAAANCGRARPRKMLSAKPCVPWRPIQASASRTKESGRGTGTGAISPGPRPASTVPGHNPASLVRSKRRR